MIRKKKWFWFGQSLNQEIDPDNVLLDSSNIPEYDVAQFEGRLEKPIKRGMLFSVLAVFIIVALIFIVQAVNLQVIHGNEYRDRSENNLLRDIPLFAGRGQIKDRNNIILAWNAPSVENSSNSVASRKYATTSGMSHLLGYVKYPSKDKNGFYYEDDFVGEAGVEKQFDKILQGISGVRLIEVDARNQIVSESVARFPIQGKDLELSIDSRIQTVLYNNILKVANEVGFSGGAGVIMDLRTGEIIAITSYPEFSSQIMSDKSDPEAIRSLLNDKSLPFLDRAIDGLYTPGSIMKPFVALGALDQNIIGPNDVIVTTGSISIPNPYDSTKSTVFRDWKNHGAVDMRKAIAVSSDAYFYIVGGGYKDQKGLGIAKIDEYLKMFGFGTTTLDNRQSFLLNKPGTIPTPEWKKKTFNEDWFVGNTYHTSIGQYGFQVTLMQIVRAVASIANDGVIISPTIIKDASPSVESVVDIKKEYFDIVKEGMRLSVTEGTALSLNIAGTEIAAKSGTAELGTSKEKINSWMTGFWPYNNPRYAFAVMMEKGTTHYLIGAGAVMKQTIEWMKENTPEYFR